MQNVQLHIIELTKTNGFTALSFNEMEMVDGGGILDWACVVGGAYSLGVGICGVVAAVGKVAVCVAICANPVICISAAVIGTGLWDMEFTL